MAVQLFLAVHDGKPIANLSRRTTSATMDTDMHGEASLSATVRMPRLAEQFRYYDREAGLDLVVTDSGREVWRGRMEETTVSSEGLRLVAYGTWRACSDVLHTAMWSDTRFGSWRTVLETEAGGWSPQRYSVDFRNRINISPNKGDVHGGGVGARNICGVAYQLPERGSRFATNLAFDYETVLPSSDWYLQVAGYSAAPTGGLWTQIAASNIINGSGSGSQCVLLSGSPVAVEIRVAPLFSPGVALTQESGTQYARITNLRLTTVPLAVSTTLAANASLGATSITLSSATEAAKVQVGMALYIGNATTPERVSVNSVSGTTIGITPLAAAKVSGDTVRAQAVRSTDIAAALIAEMNAANPSHVRAIGRLAASTADYSDVTYLDTPPAKILDSLAFAEDRTATASNGTVGLRTKSDSRFVNTWYVDATDLEVNRLLDSVRNRVYGLYTDYNDQERREDKTAAANNSRASQRRYGVVREASLSVESTSPDIVAEQVALRLADAADPAPKIQVAFDWLRTRSGQRVRPTQVRAGDILVIRNLSRSLSADIDQIGSFRIGRYSLDLLTLKPSVEAEIPPDTLERMLARPALPEFDTPIGQLNAWLKPTQARRFIPVPK